MRCSDYFPKHFQSWWMAQDLTDDSWTLVRVRSGTKPLPEPIMAQIYVATLRY